MEGLTQDLHLGCIGLYKSPTLQTYLFIPIIVLFLKMEMSMSLPLYDNIKK